MVRDIGFVESRKIRCIFYYIEGNEDRMQQDGGLGWILYLLGGEGFGILMI